MRMTKMIILVIVFSVLIAKTSLTGIIVEESDIGDFSHLTDATVKILKHCYGNEINVVGIAGQSGGIISERIWSWKYISVVLIDQSTTNFISNYLNPGKLRYKLSIFVIGTSSSMRLQRTLVEIKNSSWWNHMASYLIIDWSHSKNGCAKAYKILRTAWKMNLLNAKFVCLGEERLPLIYSFNPFTRQAPEPWKIVSNHHKITKNRYSSWTLIQRNNHDNETNLCENIDFDKTLKLDGHEIRATVSKIKMFWNYDQNKTEINSAYGFDSTILKNLFSKVNVTVKLSVLEKQGPMSFNGDKKRSRITPEVMHGISDMSLNSFFLLHMQNITTLYPHWEAGLSALSQYRGDLSQMQKLLRILDKTSNLSIYLVHLINVIFFKCFLRQSLIRSMMQTLILMFNGSLPKLPKDPAARLYLGSFLLLYINIQTIFQGKLSSLLTTRVSIRNVNKMQDLVEVPNYKIYGHSRYATFFNKSTISYVSVAYLNCTSYVLNDYWAVCIFERTSLIHDAALFDLHLSSDQFVNLLLMYVIRADWPLEDRFNVVLKRMVESNLIEVWYRQSIQETKRIIEYNQNIRNDRKFKVMNLEQLSFSFQILAVGLGCATVSFIAEVVIAHFRLKITDLRTKIFNRI